MGTNTENGKIFYMFILFMVTVCFMSDFLYDGDYEHTSIFQS